MIAGAHIVGYKIYGTPTLYDNQPLDNPRKVTDINESGQVTLADGSRFYIYGITTTRSDPLFRTPYLQSQLSLEVDIVDANKPVSKVYYKNRILSWCGNSFMPRFFPRKLPRFTREDLGTLLVSRGAAVPTMEVFTEDPLYSKQLVCAMRSIVANIEVQKNEEYVRKLGRFLIDKHPEFFNTGAWLLAHIGESEIGNAVKTHIVESLRTGQVGKDDVLPVEDLLDSCSVLIWVAPSDAKELIQEIIEGYKGRYPYIKVALALKLLTVDDWHGLDTLMNEITDPELDTSYRQGIVGTLENPLILCWQRGGSDYRERAEHYWVRLARWYRDNKSKLVWNDERQEMTFRTDDDSSR